MSTKNSGVPISSKTYSITSDVGVPGAYTSSSSGSTTDTSSGGSYSSSGSGSSSSGSTSSTDKTTSTTTDKTTSKVTDTTTSSDTTNTANNRDVTTYNTTSTDENAQKNLLAVAKNSIQNLIASQQAARELYNQNIKANQDVANQQTLENNRTASNSWYQEQQKLQNVYKALRSSSGNGQYGTAKNSLNYLTRLYDDLSDQDILNNQRGTQNEIYEDLYSANANAANDYNEELLSNQNELMDLVSSYITDFNNLLGNNTDVRDRVGENTVSTTDSNSTSTTDSTVDSTTNSESTSKYNSSYNSGDSSYSSSSTTDVTTNNNTNSTTNNNINTTSTNDVNNTTTGTNYNDTIVSTFLSPYLDADGNLDYSKISNALGINLTSSGSTQLGSKVSPGTLQQQNNYRTPADTAFALTRRYG
jgi:hypothetical protein